MRGAWGWGDSEDGEGILSCDIIGLIFNHKLVKCIKKIPHRNGCLFLWGIFYI